MPHPLEEEILHAIYAKPIDIELIQKNLDLMAKKEIYLTIRLATADQVLDVFSKGKLDTFKKHNGNIDTIKRQRLAGFLDKIGNLNELQQVEMQLRENHQVHPHDLTFLLTEALKHNAPIEIIEFLIEAGADCNSLGVSGRLPLHLAVEKNNEAAVDLLIQKGASLTLGDAGNKSLLHTALCKEHLALLKKLVTVHHCDKNVRNENGGTLLHTALRWFDLEEINLLIQLGVDPTLKDNRDQTPLDEVNFSINKCKNGISTHSRKGQIVRVDLTDIAARLQTAISLREQEKEHFLRILQRASYAQDGRLQLSSHNITNEDVSALITELKKSPSIHTINLSHTQLTPTGTDKLVADLLEHTWVVKLDLTGCLISDSKIREYNLALHPNERLKKLLSSYGQDEPFDIVRMLIDKKADFSKVHEEEGWYLWHCASSYGHVRIINALLANQIVISNEVADENDKRNCIQLAVEANQVKVLPILLNSGVCFVDEKNAAGKTALSIALDKQSLVCMRRLLEYGANPNESTGGKALLDQAIESYPAAISLINTIWGKING